MKLSTLALSKSAAFVLALLLFSGCAQQSAAIPPKKVASTEQMQQRVRDLQNFSFQDFKVTGVPRSQMSTIPPEWTGEKVRGERNPEATGAVLPFVAADGSLILVDVAYVPDLDGTGILRTAWLDKEWEQTLNACTSCTGYHLIEFYEPGIVYTVTDVNSTSNDPRPFLFTKALMQYLQQHQATIQVTPEKGSMN